MQKHEKVPYAKFDLHLNHYAIQSLNFFKAVKMTRGSANTKLFDKVRDLKYFKQYDNPATTIDTELKELRAARGSATGINVLGNR